MAEDNPELDRDVQRITSNAGRCDICGSLIDMSTGDELEIHEFGVEGEAIPDSEVQEAVASMLEDAAKQPTDRVLADVIRREGEFRVHVSCLEDTAFRLLQAE